ncbi:hypothetical protein EON63_06855 [archaeon]|nr:MAG: hypothetical protein EON63_06855 [archaeon]
MYTCYHKYTITTLGGLQTYSYFSGDGDEIFIKVRASLERLRQHASLVGMTIRMDPEYLRKHVDNRRQPIQDNADLTSLPPYQYIYAPYEYGESCMCVYCMHVCVCVCMCMYVHIPILR